MVNLSADLSIDLSADLLEDASAVEATVGPTDNAKVSFSQLRYSSLITRRFRRSHRPPAGRANSTSAFASFY